jgi:response regulator RpfG family c-di-GMP phosphodiesterase
MKWNLLGNISLLIVDDDEFNRQLVISLLSKIPSINFIEAQDGEEALSILEQTDIDMVLLDLHMPKMDGYEALKAIKREEKYNLIPIAIVTTDEQEMNRLYSLGADDFISKPFKLSELESRIYAHIEKRQYRKKYNELSNNKIQKTVLELKVNEEEKKNEKTIENKVTYTLEFIERTQKDIFYSMAKLLSIRSKNLNEIQIVAFLSKALSLLLGYDKERANTIYYATLIREIGGLSLREKVPSVYSISPIGIQQHQASILAGHKLLSSAIETNFIKVAKKVMLQSKEHFNGSGFPKQHQGNQIHNVAYIVSLVETFNALLSQKEYLNQKIHTPEETYTLLKTQSGQRFHPKITELFLTHFEYFLGLREKIIKQNL